ncbi:MAG: hypothetical protein IK055_06015 [Lachnospiraceae bacterium]|nr:hypothetical protein [Lachnospiraceae bacterium]
MYKFFMDLFTRYPGFWRFCFAMSVIGALAIIFLISYCFFRILMTVKKPKAAGVVEDEGDKAGSGKADIDEQQNKQIDRITRQMAAREKEVNRELDYLREQFVLRKDGGKENKPQ